MAKDHDKVFKRMNAEQKRKFITGETLIVTQGGKTTVEEYERADAPVKYCFKRSPTISPTIPYSRPTARTYK